MDGGKCSCLIQPYPASDRKFGGSGERDTERVHTFVKPTASTFQIDRQGRQHKTPDPTAKLTSLMNHL